MRRFPLGMTPILGFLMLSQSPAAAQPDDADAVVDSEAGDANPNPAPSDPENLVPPRLKGDVSVPYPEGVEDPRQQSVLLAITVGEDGKVSEPTIIEGAGAPFDAVALETVSSLEFEPATQDGQPVPVRIQYRMVFTPKQLPVATAPVAAEKPTEKPAQAPPTEKSGHEPVTAAPAAAPADEMFEAVADVEAPPREATRRSVSKEQLTTMPGTRGDALRAVEVLPGIGRTGFAENEGPPIIRGALPYESMVTLDGAPIPLLYHFGGLTSVYNSHLLEEVELYPGNFSARYGRVIGGVVEAKTRDPRTDGFHGMLELSLIDNFALLETPVGENTAIALAARRSNIDFVFEQLVPEDTFSVVAAPVYYDYQAMLVHRFSDKHKLKLQGYGSYDKLKLVFSNPADEDPAFRDSVEGVIQYHKLQAGLQSQLGSRVEQNLELSFGPVNGKQTFGELHQEFDGLDLHARSEWGIFASDSLRVDVGFDLFLQSLHGKYVGPPPPQEEGDPSVNQPLGSYDHVRIEDTLNIVRPGGYLELSYRPVDELLLIPGVRADYDRGSGSWVVDPRFSTRYSLTDTTTLKGGVGLYSQPPEYYQLIELFGNPDLEPYRAVHTSAGVEQEVARGFEVGLEGFYKYVYNRVVGTEGGTPPHFINDGEGRIYGAEASAELRRQGHFGYLAYTISRSERRDRDQDWRLFDYDQTHNLSAVYSYNFGSGWSAGAHFRLTTGNPDTPVLGSVYDANSDLYRAVYGETNSERSPMFHQLDVRGEKQWSFDDWSLTAYLEVLNAYNQQNVEGTSYSFDYSEKETATGLPIFPNIGIRGEL